MWHAGFLGKNIYNSCSTQDNFVSSKENRKIHSTAPSWLWCKKDVELLMHPPVSWRRPFLNEIFSSQFSVLDVYHPFLLWNFQETQI